MTQGLRILVHDFCGHPFPVDLSQALAARGHTVRHVYCEGYKGGKGDFASAAGPNLSVVGLPVMGTFAQYAPVRRTRQETQYAAHFRRTAAQFQPDIVLACNVPLIVSTIS